MKPKINFITLSVTDLEESISFYKNVFGFPVSDKSENLCLFELLDNFYLTIQTRSEFFDQAENDNADVLSAGFILSHTAASRFEVDDVVEKALEYGAIKTTSLDENWGYSVTFKDINGHHWEIVYMREQ